MKQLQEIKKMLNSANSIYSLFKQKIPHWATDKKHFDKTDWGFNIDNRFRASDSASIYFSSYMGTYGDSGCSSQCSIETELFQKNLVKYLNKNKEAIMLSIARQIEEDALKLKSEAEKELNQQMDLLKSLEERLSE